MSIAKTDENTKSISIRFPEDIYNWLRSKSEREMRSINAEVLIIVRDVYERSALAETTA